MISRRTSIAIGEAYNSEYKYTSHENGFSKPAITRYRITMLYDFLFEHNYQAWFCNLARKISTYNADRDVKDFIMRLHTGETMREATPNWSREQREELGQRYLRDLAKDALSHWYESDYAKQGKEIPKTIDNLRKSLELDGYIYEDGNLLYSESDVLDTKVEHGVLESLYLSLNLDNRETALHHLSLSEQHYMENRWDDSISNSRKFFECVLRETAAKHSLLSHKVALTKSTYERPVDVRKYLEAEGLLETKELDTIRSVYGLLSNTGGHPYIAQNDQARLLRQLALTLSQFVMLRLQGYIISNP